MVKHCEVHASFHNIEQQFQKKYPISPSSLQFFVKTFRLRCFFNHLKPPKGGLGDTAHPNRSFMFQYLRYDNSLFLS